LPASKEAVTPLAMSGSTFSMSYRWIIVSAILLMALLVQMPVVLNADLSCLLTEGEKVLDGGKLGVDGGANQSYSNKLLEAGFDAVFTDQLGLSSFRAFVTSLPARVTQ